MKGCLMKGDAFVNFVNCEDALKALDKCSKKEVKLGNSIIDAQARANVRYIEKIQLKLRESGNRGMTFQEAEETAESIKTAIPNDTPEHYLVLLTMCESLFEIDWDKKVVKSKQQQPENSENVNPQQVDHSVAAAAANLWPPPTRDVSDKVTSPLIIQRRVKKQREEAAALSAFDELRNSYGSEEGNEDDFPDEFYCSITLVCARAREGCGFMASEQEVMREPVLAADGFSYEKAAIEEWFAKGRRTSPKTGNAGAQMKNTELLVRLSREVEHGDRPRSC
eukprot:750641-Hanusia_phi.AAC.1